MKNKNLRFRLLAMLGGVCVLLLGTTASRAQTGAVNAGQENTDPGTAAIEYVAGMRVNPATGTINPQDIEKAQQSTAQMMQQRAKSDFNWTTRGPINKSGRISSFIFDSNDETGATIIAASPSGGIWKSVNGGLTYALLNNEDAIFKASKIYQADNGNLFVCTGEPADALRFNGYGSFQGDGIYTSTDGQTFSQIPGTNPNGEENSPWYCVYNFTIANSIYYAATIQGLYYSTDSGETWALAMDNDGNEMIGVATNINTTADGKLVAALNGHLYISSNGANGFVNYSTKYYNENDSLINPEKLPQDGISFITFAAAPSDAAVIYAITCNIDNPNTGDNDEYGTLEGIYATFDGGENWETIGPGNSTGFNVYTTSNGPYTDAIAVDPNNHERVIIGGTNIWLGNFVQHDSFYQWTEMSSSNSLILYIPANKHQITFYPNNANKILIASDAGINSMNIETLEVAQLNKGLNTENCYAVSTSYNGSLLVSTQSNNTLALSGYGSLPNNGYNLNFPLYTSAITGAGANSVTGGRCYFSFIYPIAMLYTNDGVSRIDYSRADDEAAQELHLDGITDNDRTFMVPSIFWESFNNQYSRDSVEYKAETFTPAGTTVTINSNNGQYPIDFELPYDLPQGNDSTIMVQDRVSSRFFIALKDFVYMTPDVVNFTMNKDSLNWFVIANKTITGFEGVSTSIAVSKDANHLFVGTEEGKIYRISNLALAYDAARADVNNTTCIVSTKLIADFEGRVVTGLAVDPQDENHIMATLGNYGYTDYVYNCTNAIAETPEFASVQGDLPAMPVYTIIVEMSNSNHAIIGTDMGIYETTDLDSWSYAGENIGAVPVFELKQQTINHYPIVVNGSNRMITNYGAIYAATGGRGVFESETFVGISDYENPETATATQLSIYPNPVENQTTVSFNTANSAIAMVNVFDLNGRVLLTKNLNLISGGTHEVTMNLEQLRHGTYIMQVVVNGQSTTAKFMVVK